MTVMHRAGFLLLLLAAVGCTRHPACVSAPTFYRQADDVRYHLDAAPEPMEATRQKPLAQRQSHSAPAHGGRSDSGR